MITAKKWVAGNLGIISSDLRKRKCSDVSSFTTLWFGKLQSEWKGWEAFIWVDFKAISLSFIVTAIKEIHTLRAKLPT